MIKSILLTTSLLLCTTYADPSGPFASCMRKLPKNSEFQLETDDVSTQAACKSYGGRYETAVGPAGASINACINHKIACGTWAQDLTKFTALCHQFDLKKRVVDVQVCLPDKTSPTGFTCIYDDCLGKGQAGGKFGSSCFEDDCDPTKYYTNHPDQIPKDQPESQPVQKPHNQPEKKPKKKSGHH